ncbi:MAG: GIY-YIG nuclease family protein [Candidatus Pacebacteria bacterium]|nr:GIY-YIG nuclease family protein [Candidatus Paceibacterota bacterium]
MQNQKDKIKKKIKEFPDLPGVYLMKNKSGKIIYIGKATSLKNRVGSYFTRDLDNKTAVLVDDIYKINFKITDNVVEALILEANLIGKYKPKYNIKLKDDKSFSNIVITDEEYPKVLISRPTDKKKLKIKYIFGPYTSKPQAEKVVNLLVKIFNSSFEKFNTANLYRGYYIKGFLSGKVGNISSKDYSKIINNIKLFLEGKKDSVIKKFEKEMKNESDKKHFEKASEIRNQIFSLRHIRDFAFIKDDDVFYKNKKKLPLRVEAYDISNISGKFSVGSMVVFSQGKPDKDEYRKFKIKSVVGANDIAMLGEVFERRFAHQEWQLPYLIIIDGGLGQKNVASIILKKYNLDIPIVAIAKGPDRKGEKLFFSASRGYVFPDVEFIKKMRDEAHRFAISYHRKLRSAKK